MIMIYIISKLKLFGKIFEKILTVEIWILNLKIWPLENRKNNGPIKIKKAGYDWRFKFIFHDADLKTIISITVKDPLCIENWTFADFNPKIMILPIFLYIQI